jgi:hypothetical protein
VQLTDKLEAKQAMVKADWECWKKLKDQFEQIHGLFSFDLYDDNQEQANWDARTRERCNVDVSQMAKEMDMSPYSLSPSSQQCVPYQDLCSKGTEGEKEEKGRENHKLQC